MSGVGMARSKKQMIQNKPNSAALKLARRACVVQCQALQFFGMGHEQPGRQSVSIRWKLNPLPRPDTFAPGLSMARRILLARMLRTSPGQFHRNWRRKGSLETPDVSCRHSQQNVIHVFNSYMVWSAGFILVFITWSGRFVFITWSDRLVFMRLVVSK